MSPSLLSLFNKIFYILTFLSTKVKLEILNFSPGLALYKGNERFIRTQFNEEKPKSPFLRSLSCSISQVLCGRSLPLPLPDLNEFFGLTVIFLFFFRFFFFPGFSFADRNCKKMVRQAMKSDLGKLFSNRPPSPGH